MASDECEHDFQEGRGGIVICTKCGAFPPSKEVVPEKKALRKPKKGKSLSLPVSDVVVVPHVLETVHSLESIAQMESEYMLRNIQERIKNKTYAGMSEEDVKKLKALTNIAKTNYETRVMAEHNEEMNLEKKDDK